jgi:thiol-disulfide isomerase/thioredoxin
MFKSKLLTAAALLAAALAGAGAWLLVGQLATPNHGPTIEKLLQLQLSDSDGKNIDFTQWRGKPLVVNFWATWCPPCREEMPLLDSSAKASPDVQFVGISVDDKTHVAAFRSTNATSYPLPITGMEISSLGAELGNKAMALPFTAFIRADGSLQSVKLGALKEAELTQELQQLAASIKSHR